MKYVFIVGCPRSGTTWLQMLLAQHPAVATAQETHLFNGYVAGLQAAWERHRKTPRHIGLQAALNEEEFNALCADFAGQVLGRIARSSATASIVLEKTPDHVHHVPLILKLFPDAYFIHLVRDPRATVASLCAAGRSWGRAWASRDPLENARLWVGNVSAGRGIASLTEHQVTVKYEDLLGPAGWRVLRELFRRMGLEIDDDFCRNALKECAIDRLRNKSDHLKSHAIVGSDPAGFYRKGKADSWADELSPQDVRVVEYVAGNLMHEYGYATAAGTAVHRKPWRLRWRGLMDSVTWRAKRAVALTFHRAHRV